MRSNKNISNFCKTIFAYAGRGLLLGVLVLGFSAAGCDDDGGGNDTDGSVLNDGGTDATKVDTAPKVDTQGDTGGDTATGDAQKSDASGDAANAG